MRITPITADEAREGGGGELFPPGEYDFVVASAEECISSTGNEQIKLTLTVHRRDGGSRTVWDYLGSSAKVQWKVRGFAEAVGLVRQYETGELKPHEMMDRPGRLKLGIEEANGPYPAKNKVIGYVAKKGAPMAASAPRAAVPARQAAPAGDIDDEIPF